MIDKQKRVLITGTTGMLGSYYLKRFRDVYGDVYTLNRHDGDLTDYNFLQRHLSKIKPDIIIHCIADTNLERCEQEIENTLLLHCGLTHGLSMYGAKFVYISSDSVMKPVNFYAKTKLLGEHIALMNNPNSLILRTNIYGVGSSSGNSLVEWALKKLGRGETIDGYTNVYFNAIYTGQLVDLTLCALKHDTTGILEAVGDYKISKYEFLQKLCQVMEIETDLINKSMRTQSDQTVIRPSNTILDPSRLYEEFKIKLTLDEGLQRLRHDLKDKTK